MLTFKSTIAFFFIFFCRQISAELSLQQSFTKDSDRNNRRIINSCRNNVCGESLRFLKKFSVRSIDGDKCTSVCTLFPRAYRLSGYECGECQCNAEWQCGDAKTICGRSSRHSDAEECLCSADTELGNFCWLNDSCNRQSCTSSSDCSGNDRCVPGTCCTDEGTGVCLSPCPRPSSSLGESSLSDLQTRDDIRRPGGN